MGRSVIFGDGASLWLKEETCSLIEKIKEEGRRKIEKERIEAEMRRGTGSRTARPAHAQAIRRGPSAVVGEVEEGGEQKRD